MEDFIKERNEALLSLDKEKILAYGKKYNVKFPENEKYFGLVFIKQYVVFIQYQ